MSERTQVNLQVSPSQKQQWETAAKENPEYQNLSHLIRMAVSRELSGGHDQQAVDNSQEMAQILERLNSLDDIQRSLTAIDSRLRDVENEVRHDPEVSEVASEVLQILPTVRPRTREWEDELQNRKTQLQAAQVGHEPDEEGARKAVEAWKGTVDGLATSLDEPTHIVRKALQKLMKDTHQVWETEDGRYVRRE